jgi:uncharacterized delta-60 repeat protein
MEEPAMKTRSTKRRRPALESLEGRTLLNAGTLDTSFGGTGEVITQLAYNAYPQGLAVQSDLKTVVVGLESPSNTTGIYPHSLVLIRYNADGSLDSTFGTGGEVVLGTNTAKDAFARHNASVAIQPDGKLVVATNTSTVNSGGSLSSADLLVLRFNADGSLDTSFGLNGETDIHLAQGMVEARGVAVLASGQIVVAGTNPDSPGTNAGPEFVVARLSSSGVLDTTFGPGGQGYDYTTVASGTTDPDTVDALGVDASGNLLVGGMWRDPSTGAMFDQVVRYTPAGLIDTSFANNGIYDLPFGSPRGIQGIGFQSNGQIILGFCSSSSGPGVTRLNPNGTLDPTFSSNGYFNDPNGAGDVAMAVQPNDEIVFETYYIQSGNNDGVLVDRLLAGGSLDPAFGTGGRAELLVGSNDGLAEGITVGPNGKITGTVQHAQSGSILGVVTYRLLGDAPVTGQLVVTTQPPASLAAGTPFGLTVDAEDSSGNIESSFNGTVTVALANNPGGATLDGTLSVTASGGVASFSGLTLTTAATGYTLVLTSNGLSETVTNAITVTPAAPTQLGFTQKPPASVTAGSGFGLTAAIEDSYGNVETGDNGTITVALANDPGGATLGGTLSEATSQGVATFSDLTLTTAASGYTLQVSSSGLVSATSSAITVTPAAASQLVITQQPPPSVKVNTGFGLTVAIEDAYGNVVTSASNGVKVAFAHNPTGAKLGGTTSVTVSQGIATFSRLTINKVGSGYTLQLTSSGLTSATTNAITVTSTGGAIPAVAGAPNGALAPLVLASPDLWNAFRPLNKRHSAY